MSGKTKYITDKPCIICGKSPSDIAHVSTRGALGKSADTKDNMIFGLCRAHHAEQHMRGWGHMIRKYVNVKRWMDKNERWDILEKIKR